MFQRTAQGIQGGGTFRIGDSTIVLGGRLARSDLGKLKRLLASAQQYYETAGYPAEALDQFGNGGYDWQSKCPEYSYNDSAGWLDDFAKGASMVRDVANNPMVASTLAATGPYGAAALAAANGVPAALDAVKAATGGNKDLAQHVAQTTHPDPRVRAAANARTAKIVKAAEAGDARAKAIRAGLQKTMALHLARQLQETQAALAACQSALAEYGDPRAFSPSGNSGPLSGAEGMRVARGVVGMGGGAPAFGAPAFTAGVGSGVVSPEMTATLGRALARTRLSPQPSWRNRVFVARA